MTRETELEKALALLRAREEELEAIGTFLEGGKEYDAAGVEAPTTLLDRVKMLFLAVEAETQGGDEARAALGAARQHIRLYRRGIRLALDEQREAGEKQDVGVLMTDLEDLLDQMADESDLSKGDADAEEEPDFTFEPAGPTIVDLPGPGGAPPGLELHFTNKGEDCTILVGLSEGEVVLDLYVPVTVEAVRIEGPAEFNKFHPTVWKRAGANDAD